MITLPEAFEQEMKQLLGEEEYEAVSYTHLDVYKRQTLDCEKLQKNPALKCKIG